MAQHLPARNKDGEDDEEHDGQMNPVLAVRLAQLPQLPNVTHQLLGVKYRLMGRNSGIYEAARNIGVA